MKFEKYEEKVRLTGYAEKDGVVAQAAKVVDCYGVPGNAFKASVGPEGNVDVQEVPEEVVQPEIMGRIKTESKKVLKVCVIAGIFFLICSCLCSFTQTLLGRACFSMVYLAMAAITLKEGIAVAIGKLRKDEEFIEFSKFNAARNAVINAYEETGAIPSISEAQAHSRFGKYCPYVRDSGLATFLVALAILMYLPFQGYLILGFACLIFFMVYEHKYLINFWQFLTTQKPEEKHFAVAIEAVSHALKDLENVKMVGGMFTLVVGEDIPEDFFKTMREEESEDDDEADADDHTDEE